MKKDKKKKLYRFIFMIFFISFIVVYFSELTGYYEYQNHLQATLTQEKIEQFEKDVANGLEVDINNYVSVETKNYNNGLSKLTSKLSDGISNLVQSGVESTFKFLSGLVEG